MTDNHVDAPDWSSIPPPPDDGAAKHVFGLALPSIPLIATTGDTIDLSVLPGRTIVYAYPRTGQPGVANPDGWDMIPGARGCSPQSCAFRDHFSNLHRLGVDHLFGLSTQDPAYQREAAQRLHLPFALLSDTDLAFANAVNLPTLVTAGMTLLKRVTLVIDNAAISHVFYPVFPPDQNASAVLEWLSTL
jgi:peroxiredoxin